MAFERVNDYDFVRIGLASPTLIRGWSCGEVKKPETINYRTYRPEKDGLFCERIFGPERDWECACGRYKGIKHKGIICDRCGVKVTHSMVRRKRMGHISLEAPVVHIWFFKSLPSRIGALLSMKTSDLEKVVYFQEYVVVDPGKTPLRERQLLSEDEYRDAVEKYGESAFRAAMGAEAIKDLLQQLDLNTLAQQLRRELFETSSKQKVRDISKRLRLVEGMRDSENKPSHMVLDVIPVIPPNLRPLVLLDAGNFATSDLNDLYRRIINRNNRLKKLNELKAPEVIIRNEKRMLQQAVDALFDNDRCKRPVLGSGNRPLKSLTDMIKGKHGRFRENLLGKRVDYSARSVIVVGPELKLHQCGLPKKIALELFQPFIIHRLRELGYADTIKSAKRMLERKDEEIWDILEEVIHQHPVLLNRAPTLHRMGIQAFEPILIEGNAIQIHPLVCKGFNADFDGDQMAVHLPLSIEAQTEALTLMMSTHNVFSPSDGNPIMAPTQDIVLGCYYATSMRAGQQGEGMIFADPEECWLACEHQKISLHAKVKVRMTGDRLVLSKDADRRLNPALSDREPDAKGGKAQKGGKDGNGRRETYLVETTAGRVLFNASLPEGMPFYNYTMAKGSLGGVIQDCFKLKGRAITIHLLDRVKTLGFQQATLGGLSIATSDMRVPKRKPEIIARTQKEIDRIEDSYRKGIITEGERYNQIVDLWTHATTSVAGEMMDELRSDTRDGRPYFNPIFMMVESGARGSLEQVRQLAGMRGLMAKPSGRIIETPIRANFREGLKVLEYFSSTHGARKGLADTALKTADAGYLTRKLADVAQNVIVMQQDCGTMNGISKSTVYAGERVDVPLYKLITGRVSRDTLKDRLTGDVVIAENELITEAKAHRVEALGLDRVRVRSVLTCERSSGVCALCYGMDLSAGKLVEEGLAVGIIAAQSIGEPGTQLTMRTFHYGGTVMWSSEKSKVDVRHAGVVRFRGLQVVLNPEGERVVLNRNGEIGIEDKNGVELEKYSIPAGSVLSVEDGQAIMSKATLAKWDPHMVPILAEKAGKVRFEDVVEGVTMRSEKDPRTGLYRKIVIEHKGDLHPQLAIEDEDGKLVWLHPIPEKAHIEVDEGERVAPGSLLAKTPREMARTQDIVGGLPRVTEIFEARKPKNPAVISEIDGVVELGEKRRGKRTIVVMNESKMRKEHLVPHGRHLRVHRGDSVRAGEPLVDGPLVPHEILRISGEEALQDYLLREVQNVYRSQHVTIDDKHIEIIVSQMMRKVRIEDPGDTEFLPGAPVDKYKFRQENSRIQGKGGRPATAKPMLLGITKASLQTDSFLSAASFQETTKVLTEAALLGKVDMLTGLKENVILGHLVPAGTGFRSYLTASVKKALSDKKQMEALPA
ncbi:MAG: DNA-directed RNA polymerase subunit beta' [Planctomycetota bacterium]